MQTIKTLVYNSVTLCGINDYSEIKNNLDLKWNNYINEKWTFKSCPYEPKLMNYRYWKFNDGFSKDDY